MAERCPLEELFAELALSRVDKRQDSANFAYPEDDVVQILDNLIPTIHSRLKDQRNPFTFENKYNYIGDNRGNDVLTEMETVEETPINRSESCVSEATYESSTLTLKSDLLGDLRPQILNQDFSFTSEFSEGISKTHDEDVYKETIIESPKTVGISVISSEKSRENIYIGPNKRNEMNEICDMIKSKSNIRLSTDYSSRNILNPKSVNHHHIPSWLSKTPIMPAEKEFTKPSCYNLKMRTPVPSNGEQDSQCRQLLEESHSQRRLGSEDGGDLKGCNSSVWSEQQSSPSDKELKESPCESAKARLCTGDIISHFDQYFRCRSSLSLLKRARSDSTITIFKSLKGMRRTCYFRSHEAPSQKSSKLGKPTILWAITKINVYPDNSRTYEVMPLSGKKPSEVPDRSDSVFVLIPPKKDQQRNKTVHQ